MIVATILAMHFRRGYHVSMFQTVGWANDTWYPRLKCIANIVATIVFLGFAAVVLVYFFCPCIAGAC